MSASEGRIQEAPGLLAPLLIPEWK